MTFEHRHENKSCSACRDRVNERVKVVKEAKVVKEKVFQNILGSQLLSDIQTFFTFQKNLPLLAPENSILQCIWHTLSALLLSNDIMSSFII